MSEADMIVREATAEDVPAIAALLADDDLGRAREAPPHDPVYARAFERLEAQPGNSFHVAEDPQTGALLGCFQLVLMPGIALKGAVRAEIESVRVAADRRGEGIGARMIAQAIREARRQGADLLQLTSNAVRLDAHRFWQAQGFEKSHAGFKMDLRG